MRSDDAAVPARRDFQTAREAELAAEVGVELSEALGDVVYALQMAPDLRFLYISPSILQLTGYSDEEHYADPLVAFSAIDPRDQHIIDEALSDEGEHVREFVVRSRRSDGSCAATQHRCRKIVREDGVVIVYAAARDVTAQVESESARSASEDRYRLLAENASDLVWSTDSEAVVEWVSPSVQSIHGWTPEDMIGRRIIEFVHPDDRGRVIAAGQDAIDGERVSFEARYLNSDGSYRWLEITARPVTDESGAVIGKVGSGRDVHAEVESRMAAQRSESRFRLAMEAAPTGMAISGLDRSFIAVNPALCRMLATDSESLVGATMGDIVNAVDDDLDLRMRDEVLTGASQSVTREVRLIRTDGATVWVQHAISLLRDEHGQPQSYVSQMVNVTEAREAREALHYMATHDSLTQLLNRRELIARVAQVLAHAPRAGARLAILFADLDGLKPVNDTFGHAAGDELIIEAAHRISALLRDGDIAARVGGDEYVIALPEVGGHEDARNVALKIRDALAEPLKIGGYAVPVGISVGIALAEPSDDPSAVIRRADAALYRAKKSGRNRIEVYDPVLDS